MIDIDKYAIEKLKKEAEGISDAERIGELLRSIMFHASRMLLVTRGAEPSSEAEVYTSFLKLFIGDGIVDVKFAPLVEAVANNDRGALIEGCREIESLTRVIFELYDNMDDSLQFKIKKEREIESGNTITTTQSTPDDKQSDAFKDLRGVACPMNFVQTKIALSAMEGGQILEILLDDGQPINNVPGSVKSEGHEVLAQERLEEGHWKVVIRKRN